MDCGSRVLEVVRRRRGYYYQIDGWIGEQFGDSCGYANSREILRDRARRLVTTVASRSSGIALMSGA